MKYIVLKEDDITLWDNEMLPIDYDYFRKHRDAFKCMWMEQGKVFWTRFIAAYRIYYIEYGVVRSIRFEKSDERLIAILDYAFKYIEECFLHDRVNPACNLLKDIVVVAQNQHMIHFIESRTLAKNPFYNRETRDVFRTFFGSPADKDSYKRVVLCLQLYIRFAGSVCVCLKRWLDAKEIPENDNSYWQVKTVIKRTSNEELTRNAKKQYATSHTQTPPNPPKLSRITQTTYSVSDDEISNTAPPHPCPKQTGKNTKFTQPKLTYKSTVNEHYSRLHNVATECVPRVKTMSTQMCTEVGHSVHKHHTMKAPLDVPHVHHTKPGNPCTCCRGDQSLHFPRDFEGNKEPVFFNGNPIMALPEGEVKFSSHSNGTGREMSIDLDGPQGMPYIPGAQTLESLPGEMQHRIKQHESKNKMRDRLRKKLEDKKRREQGLPPEPKRPAPSRIFQTDASPRHFKNLDRTNPTARYIESITGDDNQARVISEELMARKKVATKTVISATTRRPCNCPHGTHLGSRGVTGHDKIQNALKLLQEKDMFVEEVHDAMMNISLEKFKELEAQKSTTTAKCKPVAINHNTATVNGGAKPKIKSADKTSKAATSTQAKAGKVDAGSNDEGHTASKNHQVNTSPASMITEAMIKEIHEQRVEHPSGHRICALCYKKETEDNKFKKCVACREYRYTPASFYCSKDCQMSDWHIVHKLFHQYLRGSVELQ